MLSTFFVLKNRSVKHCNIWDWPAGSRGADSLFREGSKLGIDVTLGISNFIKIVCLFVFLKNVSCLSFSLTF